jgi:hypothetical protein
MTTTIMAENKFTEDGNATTRNLKLILNQGKQMRRNGPLRIYINTTSPCRYKNYTPIWNDMTSGLKMSYEY